MVIFGAACMWKAALKSLIESLTNLETEFRKTRQIT